jgi:hypothetical protein
MHLNPGPIEVVDEAMARVLRDKSGAERLRLADGLFSFARELIESSIRAAHPEWVEARVRSETARRLSHGAV